MPLLAFLETDQVYNEERPDFSSTGGLVLTSTAGKKYAGNIDESGLARLKETPTTSCYASWATRILRIYRLRGRWGVAARGWVCAWSVCGEEYGLRADWVEWVFYQCCVVIERRLKRGLDFGGVWLWFGLVFSSHFGAVICHFWRGMIVLIWNLFF